MIMTETPFSSLIRRQSTQRKKVKFTRVYESHHHIQSNENNDNELVNEVIPEDDITRPEMHWRSDRENDMNIKEQINTNTDQFDALFARSNASPFPPSHPRCYSSCSSSAAPFQTIPDASSHHYAKSQPLLISPSLLSYLPQRNEERRQSNVSSTKSQSPISAQGRRKTFSLAHTTQTFLQSSNSQSEPLEPLARSCSYKRPHSIKKYRQQNKEKEREKKEHFTATSSRKYSTTNNNLIHTVTFDSSRKSISGATPRISASDLMTADESLEQWSSPKTRRSGRVGSLPLDQLQLPQEGDEEIYRVRQFNTTSKGFVNRGDSFKRSFKRSGSISRRSSFRKTERTPSQERINNSQLLNDDIHKSTNSLTNSNITPSGPNLNEILDNNYTDSTNENILSSPEVNHDDDDDDHDDDNPLVDRIQTEDGRVQDIHIYQVYLLGMSGTGKCSLLRQFKTTEYRGIYDYSSSVEDDPDNTVSIMLDGIESRMHIINIDVDLIKSSVTGDAYIVVYSITDRQTFQTAIQLIKDIREKELITNQTSIKSSVPIILVGNKSDLVRKRDVTKETARHIAFRYNCKFVETSAAINDKVDDLLAGTLKQIRIDAKKRLEERRRLTITNGTIDIDDNDSDKLAAAAAASSSVRKGSTVNNRNSADVENLNIGIQ